MRHLQLVYYAITYFLTYFKNTVNIKMSTRPYLQSNSDMHAVESRRN